MLKNLSTKELFDFAIVFAAVSLSVYLFVSTLYKLILERLENRRGEYEELKHFVTIPKLLSMRFSARAARLPAFRFSTMLRWNV